MSEPEPRSVCERCRRPSVVCWCAHVPHLPTRTHVLLLQHPRERTMGIGTAHMAHLGLPRSELRVGIDFARDPVVAASLAAAGSSYLLFPGRDAIAVADLPRERALTLIVLDGTWSQARTLLRRNPALASLPRVAFAPRRPSQYRIRRQPEDFCLSTIEALAEVLDELEPDAGPFERLLDPFHAMVSRQQWYQTEVRSNRHLERRQRRAAESRPGPRRPSLGERLLALWPRLVCVQGEANAWSSRAEARHPPEIVHWVASRPSTGERYEAVIAPRGPLVPATPEYIEVTAERLLGGLPVEAWQRSWREFLRDGDVLVHWGRFHTDLARAAGLPLLDGGIDLRSDIPGRAGSLEDHEVPASPSSPLPLSGRAGRRLAALEGLVRALTASFDRQRSSTGSTS